MNPELPGFGAMDIISLGLLGLALLGARMAWFASASRHWPSTPGRMLFSGIQEGRGRTPFGTYVHYSYRVDGVTYESKRLRFGLVPGSAYPMAVKELNAMAGRGRLRVYYDPKKHSRSCLLTGVNELTYTVPILLGIVGLVFMTADLVLDSSVL